MPIMQKAQELFGYLSLETQELIADSLDIAYRYGLGAEIELQLVEDYFDRYSEYISGNYQAGVMTDSFTAFYQGGGPGEFYEAYRSADRTLNDVYHNTYLFTQNRYRPEEK